MPVLASVLVLLVFGAHSSFAATCKPLLKSHTPDATLARQFGSELTSLKNEFHPSLKLAALARMLRYNGVIHAEGILRRSFRARLGRARPILFRHLFDEDPLVRWAVGYTIAGLQNQQLPIPKKDNFEDVQTAANEAIVKDELERFLPHHQTQPFTYVNAYRTEVHVEVTNELHLNLAGGRPRVALPDWVSASPVVDILATTDGGSPQHRRVQVKPGPVLTALVILHPAPASHSGPMFIDVTLDGRKLDRKIVMK